MERKERLKKAIGTYGQHAQVDMCLEEMAELGKALLKLRRTDGDIREKIGNIQEELADVQIMLDQMKMMYGPEEVERWEKKKLARLNERLEALNHDRG